MHKRASQAVSSIREGRPPSVEVHQSVIVPSRMNVAGALLAVVGWLGICRTLIVLPADPQSQLERDELA